MLQERREKTRVDYVTAVSVTDREGREVQGETINISMSGLLLRTDTPLDPGISCTVRIALPGNHSRLHLEVDGVVARVEEDAMAVQFVDDMEWWTIFTVFSYYGPGCPPPAASGSGGSGRDDS